MISQVPLAFQGSVQLCAGRDVGVDHQQVQPFLAVLSGSAGADTSSAGCAVAAASAFLGAPMGFIVGKAFADRALLAITRYIPHFQAFYQRGKNRKSPYIAISFAKLVYDLVYWCTPIHQIMRVEP